MPRGVYIRTEEARKNMSKAKKVHLCQKNIN